MGLSSWEVMLAQQRPLISSYLFFQLYNSDGNARLDVAAINFWSSNNQRSFFDIRVFNPLASSNRASSANSVYQKHEREKRRGYEQRVREIENGCFSPLVFNTLGGMGPTAQVVYKRLADLIADKLHIVQSFYSLTSNKLQHKSLQHFLIE